MAVQAQAVVLLAAAGRPAAPLAPVEGRRAALVLAPVSQDRPEPGTGQPLAVLERLAVLAQPAAARA